jgi:hypothetical protein
VVAHNEIAVFRLFWQSEGRLHRLGECLHVKIIPTGSWHAPPSYLAALHPKEESFGIPERISIGLFRLLSKRGFFCGALSIS